MEHTLVDFIGADSNSTGVGATETIIGGSNSLFGRTGSLKQLINFVDATPAYLRKDVWLLFSKTWL